MTFTNRIHLALAALLAFSVCGTGCLYAEEGDVTADLQKVEDFIVQIPKIEKILTRLEDALSKGMPVSDDQQSRLHLNTTFLSNFEDKLETIKVKNSSLKKLLPILRKSEHPDQSDYSKTPRTKPRESQRGRTRTTGKNPLITKHHQDGKPVSYRRAAATE